MAISLTLSSTTPTVTAKISDVTALIAAINTELGALTARIDGVEGKLAGLVAKARVDDIDRRVAAVEAKPAPVDLSDRVAALEAEPDPVVPPDLTDRVAALEALIRREPAEAPAAGTMNIEPLPRPRNLPTDQPHLVYDKATIYLGDMELHADRIGDNHWRLYANLNYIVVSPVAWTYDEIVEGTADEVYRHALARLEELAELKPQHDAVHTRVREMSEGR